MNTFAPLRLTYNTDEIVVWYDSNPKTTESHADMWQNTNWYTTYVFALKTHYNEYIHHKTMNKNYYIKEIRDLSKNYDSESQSKILDDLTDKFFDVKCIKELYDILMEEVYGDGGIKGY